MSAQPSPIVTQTALTSSPLIGNSNPLSPTSTGVQSPVIGTPLSSSPTILEGWLKKEGNGGVWKNRYAVLSSRKLELFKDEKKNALLGNIHVRDAECTLEKEEREDKNTLSGENTATSQTSPSSPSSPQKNSPSILYVFTIKTSKNKLYTLATTSKQDAEQWVSAISQQAVMLSARHPSANTSASSLSRFNSGIAPDSPVDLSRKLSGINLSEGEPFKNVHSSVADSNQNNTKPAQQDPVHIVAMGPPTVTTITITLEKGVLKVNRTYTGSREGNSIIEWMRSDDGGKEFRPIEGAFGMEYKPTADDLECDLKVKYVPVDIMGDKGLIAYSENFKLKLEPSFFNHLKNIFLQGYAVFTVKEVEDGGSIVLLLNRKKLKVRKGKTIAKANFNIDMQVKLDMKDNKIFHLDLNGKKKNQFTFQAPSAVGRDGIALTIRLFNALGAKEIGKYILGEKGRIGWANAQSPSDAIVALRDRCLDPIPNDAPRGILIIRKAIEKLLQACENT